MQNRLGEWAVWHGSGSCEYHEPPPGSECHPTEELAWAYAHQLEQKIGYVEYGIGMISPQEQETSLRLEIDDLQDRLRRLCLTGTQYAPPRERPE